jgi:hypothetical protein
MNTKCLTENDLSEQSKTAQQEDREHKRVVHEGGEQVA